MATRRRRRADDEEDGLVEMVLSLSWERPAVGLVASGVLLLIAAIAFVLPFGEPLLRMLAQIFAALIGMISIFGIAAGIAALVRDRLGLRGPRGTGEAFTLESLRAMPWRDFERFVARLYRQQGFRVREVGGSGDGGIDLIATKAGGVEHLIQCKALKDQSVGEPKVREFYGAMAAHRTRCEGIFVTSSDFTQAARDFAAGKPLRLINGDELVRLANEMNPIAPAVETYIAPPAPPPAAATAPTCPRCGGPMHVKTARRGARAGKPFWGCVRFPACDGLINC